MIALPFVLSALLCASTPSSVSSEEGRLLRALEQIRREPRSMRAAIGLWQVQDLLPYADGNLRRQVLDTIGRLAEDPRAPLPVRRLALRMLAEQLRSAGEAESARNTFDRLGPVRDWWVIGPFDNEGHAGFDAHYEPEKAIDLSASAAGKGHAVEWRLAPLKFDDGRLPLHPLFLPREAVAAYAFTVLEAPRPTPILMWVGCDDGCKVWLNGKNVLSDPGTHPLRDDQHALALTLPEGQNRLLVKITQLDGAWGLSLFVTDPAGRSLPEVRASSDQSVVNRALASPPPSPPERIARGDTLASWFEDQAARRPNDPALLADAALAIGHTAARDTRERQAEELLSKAIEKLDRGTPAAVDLRLALARITDHDLSRSLLEEAVEIAPHRAEALSRLGALHHVRAETEKALRYHQRALAANPSHLPSQLEMAELLQELSLAGLSAQRIAALLERHPDVPEVLSVAALLYRRMNLRRPAEELFRRLVAIVADDQIALRALHEASVQRGDLIQALSSIDRLLLLDPLRTGWWIDRGDLLLYNKRADEALESYRRAVAICPSDPTPLIREGNALMALGRIPETIERWRRALALSPQDQALERRIRAIQPTGEAFYQPWVVDPLTLIKTGSSVPSGDAVTDEALRLLDLTVVRLYPNGMVSRYRQELVRIQNSRGAKSQRTFRIGYSIGRQEIRVLQARVFRAAGSVDTSATSQDFSISEPWYNLYYDIHAREVSFPFLAPGDVVELSYLVDDLGNQSLLGRYFGDLVPLQIDQPTKRAAYVLLAPADYPLFFNQPVGATHRLTHGNDGTAIHVWEASDLVPIEPEPNMPGLNQGQSFLHVSTFQNWAELAGWFGTLVFDQLRVGPEVRQKVRELTAGATDPLEKIRAIYRFVADRTRYVGLEFGIHSYIPYQAGQVLERGFGDCKDKSALLVAMFREAGIPARLALVRMTRLGRIPAQPASLAIFNHAVCFLPEQNLWLDGTASFFDVLDLPPQDQDTLSLILEEGGGRLVTTPRTTADRNQTEIAFEVEPRLDGAGRVRAQIVVQGNVAPEMRARLLGANDPNELFEKTIHELFPGARILSVKVDNLQRSDLPLITTSEFEVLSLGRTDGVTIEVPALGRDPTYQQVLASLHRRRSELLLGSAWSVHWSVRWKTAVELRPADLPPADRIQSPFGMAEVSYRREPGAVLVTAEFRLTTSHIAAADYPAFRDFLMQVDRLLGKRLRLVGATHEQG